MALASRGLAQATGSWLATVMVAFCTSTGCHAGSAARSWSLLVPVSHLLSVLMLACIKMSVAHLMSGTEMMCAR